MLFYLLSALQVAAQSPQCVSGRMNFEEERMYAAGSEKPNLDVSKYDFTIDYGASNVDRNPAGGIDLKITKAGDQGFGTRVSTTRYLQYARITAKMNAISVPGAVATFITMSPRKDEIDWEFVGGETQSGQTNVFYKGIEEFGVRSATHSTGLISESRTYVIDWKSDAITWSVNDQVVRTYSRDSPEAQTELTPAGERSYPTEPTQIQIGVWDGGSSESQGTRNWAGGPIPWGDRTELSATYEYIEIQCYDDQDQPVPKWPNTPENPDKAEADPGQPTKDSNPLGSRAGSTGSTSAAERDVDIPQSEGLPTQEKSDGVATSVGFSTLVVAPLFAMAF